MKGRLHDDAMAEMYKNDPEYAFQLINSILEDGNQSELLITFRQMAKAFGGIPKLAKEAHLNQTQLYRTLSPEGNPGLNNFLAILKAMGMRLSVQPVHVPYTDQIKRELAKEVSPNYEIDDGALTKSQINKIKELSGIDQNPPMSSTLF